MVLHVCISRIRLSIMNSLKIEHKIGLDFLEMKRCETWNHTRTGTSNQDLLSTILYQPYKYTWFIFKEPSKAWKFSIIQGAKIPKITFPFQSILQISDLTILYSCMIITIDCVTISSEQQSLVRRMTSVQNTLLLSYNIF